MKATPPVRHPPSLTTIAPGHRCLYLANRGKLAHRAGQVVTVLLCHRVQVLVRFPDGSQAHTERRHLAPLNML